MANEKACGPAGIRIVQLGFTVRDREAAISEWIRTMGAGPFFVADVAMPMTYRGQEHPTHWRVAHGCSGDLYIELIEAAEGPSIYTECNLGLHHVMVSAESGYGPLLSHFLEHGCQVAAEHDSEMARFCYLDGASELAPFIELYDMPPTVVNLFERIRTAHRGWDGSDPIRPLI